MAKIETRKHLERAQPHSRLKYGLLEKKKDYKLRADDYNKKKAKLKVLREKARFKNADEFYHSMINSFTTGRGIHKQISDRNANFDADTMKLLKTQDAKYVQYHLDCNRKRIAAIKDELCGFGIVPSSDITEIDFASELLKKSDGRNHTRFEGSVDEECRETAQTLSPEPKSDGSGENEEVILRLLLELRSRYRRDSQLSASDKELQTQRHMMSAGRRYKVGKDAKGNAQFKWRQERKK